MTILMVRPVMFGYNAQTAVNNTFQVAALGDFSSVQADALREFDAFVDVLRSNDIDVLVVQDTSVPHTPDSIFPNNWVSFHRDGSVVLYPMFAENRRLERNQGVLDAIKERFSMAAVIDFSANEHKGAFLEGTGSMVLDRENRIAYACRSPRTDESLFLAFCKRFGYRPMLFAAVDERDVPIYHTNVMMCVADRYAVMNLDSVQESDRAKVTESLAGSGKTIIPISFTQMSAFAGNMLQVENKQGRRLLVMSSRAYRSLLPAQLRELAVFNPVIHSSLDTIEQNGGGSARCMMAEVYLPLNG